MREEEKYGQDHTLSEKKMASHREDKVSKKREIRETCRPFISMNMKTKCAEKEESLCPR
jgi:hypothetical protein